MAFLYFKLSLHIELPSWELYLLHKGLYDPGFLSPGSFCKNGRFSWKSIHHHFSKIWTEIWNSKGTLIDEISLGATEIGFSVIILLFYITDRKSLPFYKSQTVVATSDIFRCMLAQTMSDEWEQLFIASF